MKDYQLVWNIIDVVKNSQGEAFVGFLRGGYMTVVSGRKGRDALTCVSGRGCSVVDYCIVGKEDFGMIELYNTVGLVEGCSCMNTLQGHVY